ncbi:MAG: hypothetical protein GTN39_03030 [Candidatus Aenigmarchaeota archaeon]|nr:hypothetical protein [Candidatus Aenigmarchaeota archaeon]
MMDRRNFFKCTFYGSCLLALDYKTKINEIAKEIYKILLTDCDQKVGDMYSSNIHADVDGNPKNGWEHVNVVANTREDILRLRVTDFDRGYAKDTRILICKTKIDEIESDYEDKTALSILRKVFNKMKEKESLKPIKK